MQVDKLTANVSNTENGFKCSMPSQIVENNINDKNYKNFDFKKGKEIVLEYANWSTENLFTTNNFDDNIELKKNTMIYY